MTGRPLAAALIDVGGTLWPDGWPWLRYDHELRRERLRRALPGLRSGDVASLLRALDQSAALLTDSLEQELDAYVGGPLRRHGFEAGAGQLAAAVDAMCLPAAGLVSLFPGAVELLRAVREAGLGCVIVSNTYWRTGELMARDFEALGLTGTIDAIVSSVDVGFRKPHPAMFEAAMAAAGAPAAACAMVGNSEPKDVVPARRLGMRTIRVAIEEPRPAGSEADAVVGSLAEAASLLRSWAAAR